MGTTVMENRCKINYFVFYNLISSAAADQPKIDLGQMINGV